MIILFENTLKNEDNKTIKFNKKSKLGFFIFFLIINVIININHTYLSHIFPLTNLEKEKYIQLKLNQNQKKDAVLLMAPRHGNLGDQAITLGEIKFLKEIFDIKIVFNLENYRYYINNNTIIFLHGGGNIGWTYNFEEENRRKIINSYPNNYIIILPQTIFFEAMYKEQEKISSEIYSNHSKLIIITREKVSFDIANKIFQKNKILLSPDIVTYLDDLINLNNIKRKGALFLLRKDREKFLNENIQKKIIFLVKKIFNEYYISDTDLPNLVINSISQSKEIVSMLLKNISKHEIVITDRLHGMIFCVITKTSCIVIKNYNHKIISSYEWFKDLDFIKLVNSNNLTDLEYLIHYLKDKQTPNVYKKNIFQRYYNTIRQTFIDI